MSVQVDLVECPRDAMQGWEKIIPTAEKINYLNQLLQVGFHTLDFGSFVSAKAIPQLADTHEVLQELKKGKSKTRLLAIMANVRGAEAAVAEPLVDDLGYPFSVSPTFQMRNAHSTIAESETRLKEILDIAFAAGKQVVVYLSMAFGNPYGDPYSEGEVLDWARRMHDWGVSTISLADTVGLASPEQVFRMTKVLVEGLQNVQVGVHLHSTIQGRTEKVEAAWQAGARRFDGALLGLGGCPMSGDALVGNLDMVWLERFLQEKGVHTGVDAQALWDCTLMAPAVFGIAGSGH
jgi:hydroxymethylglutaryl-CoA lyase